MNLDREVIRALEKKGGSYVGVEYGATVIIRQQTGISDSAGGHVKAGQLRPIEINDRAVIPFDTEHNGTKAGDVAHNESLAIVGDREPGIHRSTSIGCGG